MKISLIAAAGFLMALSQTSVFAQPKVSQWEVHEGLDGIVPFKTDNADMRKAALGRAQIPPAGHEGWKTAETVSATDAAAKYSRGSKLTRPNQDLDFTYFQSIVSVPAGFPVSGLDVFFDTVDDAARIWIFNDKHPHGIYLSEADVIGRQEKKATADLKAYVATGDNRVVVAQYDNAPVLNNISGIRIRVNGNEVKAPTENEIGVILYDQENFTGLKLPYTEGTHDIYSSKVGLNDLVSSVKVKPGWKVTLYQDYKLQGKSIVLTSDTPELNSKGFNNITSGVKIERVR